jgi:hypothetical protein
MRPDDAPEQVIRIRILPQCEYVVRIRELAFDEGISNAPRSRPEKIQERSTSLSHERLAA